MAVITNSIKIATKGKDDVINVTSKVGDIVSRSKIINGMVTVFVPGSTASVTTMEFEPGLIKDIKAMGERIAPSNEEYAHHQTWDDGNGSSHIRASVIGPSLIVPFVGRKMMLGPWQQIVMIDHDVRPRSREIIVQMMGE